MSVASTKNYVAGFINPDNVSLQALNLTSINPLTGEPTFITLSTNEDEELLINDIPVSGGGGSGYALLGSSNTFTQPNLFNGVGPSTLQIGNSEGFKMSLTAIDTPNYALQISNGGLYLGNTDGSPEDSKFVLLSCSDATDGELLINGNLNVEGGSLTIGGTTITPSSGSGVVINNNVILESGSLSVTLSCNDTVDSTLVVAGNIELTNNGYIALPYLGQDDIQIFQNEPGNMVITNGGIQLGNPTDDNSVLIQANADTANLLSIYSDLEVSRITLAYPPVATDNSRLVPTTAWVNAAIAAAIAAIP